MTWRRKHTETELTDWLRDRIWRKPRYHTVETHVTYHKDGLDGEMDVIGRVKGGKDTYYEIKSNDCSTAWKRAKDQFKRAEAAYPGQYNFVYVTPTRVKRYVPL